MTPKTPLTVGSYDDGGQVSDANGFDLFTFGCNDDTREMDGHTLGISKWVLHRLNNYDRLVRCLEMISEVDVPFNNDGEHDTLNDVIYAASNALRELR